MITLLTLLTLLVSPALDLPDDINYWRAFDHAMSYSSSATSGVAGGYDYIKLSYTYVHVDSKITNKMLDELICVYLYDIDKDEINTAPPLGSPVNYLSITTYNGAGSQLNYYEQSYKPVDMKIDKGVTFERFSVSLTSVARWKVDYVFPVYDASYFSSIMNTMDEYLYFGDVTFYAYTVLQTVMADVYSDGFNAGYNEGYIQGEENAYLTIEDSGALNGVFGLFSTGFNSLASILAIPLFPGFTLGSLLFLPLIAGIGFGLIRLLMGSGK
jgi:hypothetical protein